MEFPIDLLYTKDHEWIRIEGNTATVGITAFACSELGDIVYVELECLGQTFEEHDVFGTIEAVKTVSDLFMPVGGRITEVNSELENKPELVGESPYNEGWLIKIEITQDMSEANLKNANDYRDMIGR